MGLENRTVKIIVIVTVTLLIIGSLLGLLLGFLLYQQPYIVLEVWPKLADDEPLIHFAATEPTTWHPWVRHINEFLSGYETSAPEDPPHAPCSTHPQHEDMQRSEHCTHAMRYWENCTVDTLYGYLTGTPCVFLRLAHIDHWSPHPYNVSVNLPLPPDMPEHLKQGLKHPSAALEDYIWVSCKGESPVDDENIGRIRYIPESLPPGFPLRRLHTANRMLEECDVPYRDGGPLVAVIFPNLMRGVIISVECRIWTRDVVYNRNNSIGRTRFEILID